VNRVLRGELKKKAVLLLGRGYNYQQVADKTGLTYRQVRSIAEREGLTKKRKVYELSEQVRNKLSEIVILDGSRPAGQRVRADIDLRTETIAKIDYLKNIFPERYSRGDIIEILLQSVF
jgi:hypothetical protein